MQNGVAFVEFPKVHPVKTDEAILRTQPQETIARLQNGVDGGLK